MAVEFVVVIVTDNDPMARVLSVAVVSFIAGMLMVASTLARARVDLGIHLLHRDRASGSGPRRRTRW